MRHQVTGGVEVRRQRAQDVSLCEDAHERIAVHHERGTDMTGPHHRGCLGDRRIECAARAELGLQFMVMLARIFARARGDLGCQ